MASVTPYYGKHHDAPPDDWLSSFMPKSKDELKTRCEMFQQGFLNVGIMHLLLKKIVELEQPFICFYFHQKLSSFQYFNKENLLIQSRKWRDSVRRGELKVQRDMCHSGTIWGKKYYMLVIEPELAGLLNINPDPVLLLYFQYMVGGSYVYFFPNEKNRDAIFKFVNDLPKDQPIEEEKHEADA